MKSYHQSLQEVPSAEEMKQHVIDVLEEVLADAKKGLILQIVCLYQRADAREDITSSGSAMREWYEAAIKSTMIDIITDRPLIPRPEDKD